MDPSGPFNGGPSGYIFTLFSCPLHPVGSSSFSGRTRGVTVQGSRDDSSKAYGSMVSIRMPWTTPTPDRLSKSNYDAWHVSLFDWILPRIEASLCLPCTSSINITLFLSHFSIFSWNTLSERFRHPCQRPLHSIVVSVINTLPPFIHKIGKYSLFHKSLLLVDILFIFLDFIHPSSLLDPSES